MELMVTLIVVGILLGLGVPAFQEAAERRRIDGVVDEIQTRIALAKSEAIKRNVNVSVAFVRTDAQNWCLGMDEDTTAACDCSTANDCQVDGLERVLSFAPGDQLELTAAPLFDGASGDAGNNGFAFEPSTGAMTDLGDNGTVIIETTEGNYQLQVSVNPLGLTSVCYTSSFKQVGGYEACTP